MSHIKWFRIFFVGLFFLDHRNSAELGTLAVKHPPSEQMIMGSDPTRFYELFSWAHDIMPSPDLLCAEIIASLGEADPAKRLSTETVVQWLQRKQCITLRRNMYTKLVHGVVRFDYLCQMKLTYLVDDIYLLQIDHIGMFRWYFVGSPLLKKNPDFWDKKNQIHKNEIKNSRLPQISCVKWKKWLEMTYQWLFLLSSWCNSTVIVFVFFSSADGCVYGSRFLATW